MILSSIARRAFIRLFRRPCSSFLFGWAGLHGKSLHGMNATMNLVLLMERCCGISE